jgi:hypothetical protein
LDGQLPFISYPPVEKHGVTGDWRSATLVAGNGILDWLCWPNYHSPTFLGLYWIASGAVSGVLGQSCLQWDKKYLDESPVLVTTWETTESCLELADILP